MFKGIGDGTVASADASNQDVFPRGSLSTKNRAQQKSHKKSMFDPWGLKHPKIDPWVPPTNQFSKCFVKKRIFPKRYLSQKHDFRGLEIVSSLPGYEHRVRDGLLHLLVVGNLWGMSSNLLLACFRTSIFFVSVFVLALNLVPKQPLGNTKNRMPVTMEKMQICTRLYQTMSFLCV